MTDGADLTAEDAVRVAQRALERVNELEALEDEVEELREELTAVQLRLSERDDDRPYEQLTLDEKIGMVREHAFERATDSNGLARLTYDDIMWEVFDGEPGAKHCYKLMRRAAGDTEDEQEDMDAGVPGFCVRDPDGGTKHIAVNADRAKRGAAFFPENKTASEGGRLG